MRVLLPALLLALALAPDPARAQACASALPRAEADYRAGRFDEAIDRLERCLDANAFQADERRQAYRLIGLSFIGKDREAEAREAVRNLLLAAPDYRPDPNLDPPPFVALVEQERRADPRPEGRAGGLCPPGVQRQRALGAGLHPRAEQRDRGRPGERRRASASASGTGSPRAWPASCSSRGPG
jgi:tetratricopeptide (TPR) repeat protein